MATSRNPSDSLTRAQRFTAALRITGNLTHSEAAQAVAALASGRLYAVGEAVDHFGGAAKLYAHARVSYSTSPAFRIAVARELYHFATREHRAADNAMQAALDAHKVERWGAGDLTSHPIPSIRTTARAKVAAMRAQHATHDRLIELQRRASAKAAA